jgi:hypothetical protein
MELLPGRSQHLFYRTSPHSRQLGDFAVLLFNERLCCLEAVKLIDLGGWNLAIGRSRPVLIDNIEQNKACIDARLLSHTRTIAIAIMLSAASLANFEQIAATGICRAGALACL